MIKYKIIEYTANAIHLLGYAKHLALGVIQTMPQRDGSVFTKSARVGDVQIKTRGARAGGDWIVRLSVIGVAAKRFSLVKLGDFRPFIGMGSDGKPLPATPNDKLTLVRMIEALLPSRFVTYISEYIHPGGKVVGDLPDVVVTSDPQAGSIGVADIIGSREFDFDAGLLYVEYQATVYGVTNKHWAALSLSAILNQYTASFPVAAGYTGDLSFAVPMLGGQFTINLVVKFKNGLIESYPRTTNLGGWTLAVLNMGMSANTAIVTYSQAYAGYPAYVAVSVKTFTMPKPYSDWVPASRYTAVLPDIFGNDKPGVVEVPASGTTFTVEVSGVLRTPLVKKPATVYLLSLETYTATVSDHIIVTSNWQTASHGINTYRNIDIKVCVLNGGIVDVSGPSVDFSYSYPSSPPDLSHYPRVYTYYGFNGLERRLTAPDISTSPFVVGEWIANEPALGYSARRYNGNTTTSKENYDISYGGAVVRDAVRALSVGSSGYGLTEGTENTVDGDPWYSEGTIGLAHWVTENFLGYDAPVSVCNDIVVVPVLSLSSKTISNTTIVLLPLGWTPVSAGGMRSLDLVSGLLPSAVKSPLTAIRDEFKTALDLNPGHAALTSYVAFMNNLLSYIGTPVQPTQEELVTQLVTFFTPETKFLQGDAVSAEMALCLGAGTFFSVVGV